MEGDKLVWCHHEQEHLIDLLVNEVSMAPLIWRDKRASATWWLCCDKCFQSSPLREAFVKGVR